MKSVRFSDASGASEICCCELEDRGEGGGADITTDAGGCACCKARPAVDDDREAERRWCGDAERTFASEVCIVCGVDRTDRGGIACATSGFIAEG